MRLQECSCSLWTIWLCPGAPHVHLSASQPSAGRIATCLGCAMRPLRRVARRRYRLFGRSAAGLVPPVEQWDRLLDWLSRGRGYSCRVADGFVSHAHLGRRQPQVGQGRCDEYAEPLQRRRAYGPALRRAEGGPAATGVWRSRACAATWPRWAACHQTWQATCRRLHH